MDKLRKSQTIISNLLQNYSDIPPNKFIESTYLGENGRKSKLLEIKSVDKNASARIKTGQHKFLQSTNRTNKTMKSTQSVYIRRSPQRIMNSFAQVTEQSGQAIMNAAKVYSAEKLVSKRSSIKSTSPKFRQDIVFSTELMSETNKGKKPAKKRFGSKNSLKK